MNQTTNISRRRLLANAAALGISVNFLGSVAFAASDAGLAKRKFVVLICRGAMDGLSVFPPAGDSNYASLRGGIAVPGFGQPDGALKIDSTFGLHPSLATVHRLALAGQARIAPAVSTPDRSRSHFEAQDVLECGLTVPSYASGWLNRALQATGPGRATALSLGPEMPLILRGKVSAATWSPGALGGNNERLTEILTDLYAKDPLLGPALASGLASESIASEAGITDVQRPGREMGPSGNGADSVAARQAAIARQREVARNLGRALAGLMAAEHGPSIAAMSITGFDTHVRQAPRIAERLAYLDGVVDGLAGGLADKWKDTVVVAITEFGRTAHVNGTEGTDHGTGSAALLVGGALKPGGIVGDWPTLAQSKLFENRDLAPTLDMRGLLKGVLAEHLAIDKTALSTTVFPGSANVAPATNLVG